MKWPSAICLFVVALGAASEESTMPPSLEGLNPSQIEKIMIEEILAKPKGKEDKEDPGKEPLDFVKTVKPILEKFKKQLLADKKKMQKTLDDDLDAINKCITDMKKSAKLGLLQMDKKKKKKAKKCLKRKDVDKCHEKQKKMGKKDKVCEELGNIGKKDFKSILELIKQWNKQKIVKKDCIIDKGEARFHYVTRLANHFTQKLEKFEKKLKELLKEKKNGKKLDKRCDVVRHYHIRLKEVECEEKKAEFYACSCGKVIKENEMCKIFDGCYSAAVTAAKDNEIEIKKKNAAAKLEWRAVGRIECLLKVMGGKKGADEKALDNCVNGPQVKTKPLDLKYHPIPDKGDCALKGVDDAMRKMCKFDKKKQ